MESLKILRAMKYIHFFATSKKLLSRSEYVFAAGIHIFIYTANIFVVFFTVFSCVRISTVISQYDLHLIAAQNTVE